MPAPTRLTERPSSCSNYIILQAGDQNFTVDILSLASASVYFANILSPDHDLTLPRMTNGAYIVDTDPIIFSHIIDYVLTRRFPLFYTIREGFNKLLYKQLFDLADKFVVIKLALWIGRRGYESVLRVEKSIRIVRAAELRWNSPMGTKGEQVEVKYHGDGAEEDAEYALVISKRTLVNWEALGTPA